MSIDAVTERLIQRAKRGPKLSPDEELEHIRAWHARRDRESAAIIAEANLRHVVFTALKFRSYGIPVADLISEGNIGLMTALDRYEADKGARFGTYAAYWIRAHVVLAVMSSWSLVSGPRGALSTRVFFRLRRERARLAPFSGEREVTANLAERFGVSERRMEAMLAQIDHRGVSLDTEMSRSGARVVDELTAGDDQEAALASCEAERWLESAVERARPTLSSRETFILERRLLADPDEELSLGEIGALFGVSRERVRQLEERTRAKLRSEAIRDRVTDQGRAASSFTSTTNLRSSLRGNPKRGLSYGNGSVSPVAR